MKSAASLRDTVFRYEETGAGPKLTAQVVPHIFYVYSLPAKTITDVTEANTFASMRKVAETSETRFDEKSPFRDQAGFFASGTSNNWEGRLLAQFLRIIDPYQCVRVNKYHILRF